MNKWCIQPLPNRDNRVEEGGSTDVDKTTTKNSPYF